MANDAFSSELTSTNTDVGDSSASAPAKQLQSNHHSTFWFEDGSLIVQVQADAYKIHSTILTRLSATFAAIAGSHSTEDRPESNVVRIPDELGVSSRDMEALLGHIYHDKPLDCERSSSRLASILRITSKDQLNFPSIHQLARDRLERVFNTTVDHFICPDDATEALEVAIRYNILLAQKALFYSVATTVELDSEHTDDAGDKSQIASASNSLSPEVIQRCKNLLDNLMSHFTPILFTVATANHMACTDVFAEMWMPLVIQPALENSGLCRPIETLQEIMDVDWGSHGMCESCIEDKRDEWRAEQRAVWSKLDDWIVT